MSSTLTLSDASAPIHRAPAWDAVRVLQLQNDDVQGWTCVGHAPSRGRRCQKQIAGANIQAAKDIVRRLGRMELQPTGPEMLQLLNDLADRMLCRHYHHQSKDPRQHQTIVETWQNRIRRLRRDRETPGSGPSASTSTSGSRHASSSSTSSFTRLSASSGSSVRSGFSGVLTPPETPRSSSSSSAGIRTPRRRPASPTPSYMSTSSSYITPSTPSTPSTSQSPPATPRPGRSPRVINIHRLNINDIYNTRATSTSNGPSVYRGPPTPPLTPRANDSGAHPNCTRRAPPQQGNDARIDALQTQIQQMQHAMEEIHQTMMVMASFIQNQSSGTAGSGTAY